MHDLTLAPVSGTTAATVVVVDDDPSHLELLTMTLESYRSATGERFAVMGFEDPAEALSRLPAEGPVVMICDNRFPLSTGLDWLPDFVRADMGPVILLTGTGSEEIAAEAFRQGASDYLTKSAVLDEPSLLHGAVTEALRRHQLVERNRELSRALKLANAELARKNERLARLTDAAHRFVDDVAHDFRTPLAVIQEFSSLVLDGIGGTLTSTQSEYVTFIHAATKDLAHLVDDFLDSSKLRAGVLGVDRHPVAVATIIDPVRHLIEARAAARAVSVEIAIDPDLPLVFADPEKARRVLVNLAVNGIKFTARNSRIRITARTGDAGGVCIGVADQGPGLSAAECRAIFERFRQGPASTQEGIKGFGLGLSIARELTHINLGALGVTSTPGAGSEFTFTLVANEPGEIVRRHLDHVATGAGPGAVAVLEVRAGDDDSAALRTFLTGACHPLDLVIEGVETGEMILVGATAEPDRWIERLRGMDDAPPFTATVVMTADPAEQRRDLEHAIRSRLPDVIRAPAESQDGGRHG
ncbi:MAG: hybrid sensor histidine kinase/response regulator [Phycisphaerales bacterium]|nr:hybrid sensor histidine kinase/response regulator [Phycisphaerae bacterium]NNF44135.1 hybrid sensor histidine kinase/response regulator [Phycisphaerales bacterium]NNM26340.1 hybrid sensor histidine kinase/response regulator [Phycisphaerales bacterium]